MVEKRKLGGVEIPVLGQGTWNMERDAQGSIAALRRGVELGLTHVDTAEMYGAGRVEEIVGEALVGLRDRVYLVSKVLPTHASRQGTVEACERSLKRLKTDALDLYLLHWPGEHPLEETIAAFEALVKAGKIRRYGVSNFDPEEVEKAARLGRIACDQVLYNLQERTIERGLIGACESRDIAVVAYSPLGGDAGFRSGPALEEVARRRGATPRQVALAFLLRRAFVIVKSSSAAHVEENARIPRLEKEDVEALEKAFPVGPWRGLATL